MTKTTGALALGTVVGIVALVGFGLGAAGTEARGLWVQDAASEQRPTSVEQVTVDYDRFMALPVGERRSAFSEFGPADKAFIFRTHADRWLSTNRSRLTVEKIALVQDHIAYLTPAIYRTPIDPEIRRQGDELMARMTCGLSHREIGEAFDPLDRQRPFNVIDAIGTWWDCATR